MTDDERAADTADEGMVGADPDALTVTDVAQLLDGIAADVDSWWLLSMNLHDRVGLPMGGDRGWDCPRFG